MENWVVALIVFAIFGALVLGLVYCLKVFNGPDGERFRKLDVQGPFVPLGEAQIEEDANRMRSRPKRIGSAMLLQAAATARDLGAKNAALETFEWQAPGFYAKHGYVEAGRIE